MKKNISNYDYRQFLLFNMIKLSANLKA